MDHSTESNYIPVASTSELSVNCVKTIYPIIPLTCTSVQSMEQLLLELRQYLVFSCVQSDSNYCRKVLGVNVEGMD